VKVNSIAMKQEHYIMLWLGGKYGSESARGRGADDEPYFPSERALTSLLPMTTQQPNRLPGHS
jgi:hypothetical protein